MESAAASVVHDHEHHGPPPAHRSSRVEPQFLGMVLFIISEVVISTLPDYRSKWMEGGLIDRIKRQTGKPVIHVESSDVTEAAGSRMSWLVSSGRGSKRWAR